MGWYDGIVSIVSQCLGNEERGDSEDDEGATVIGGSANASLLTHFTRSDTSSHGRRRKV